MPDETAYRVLARKYRPQSFATLIGQEAMVRTLGNAIASGRLAHAFILTGVRGIGKTTTARLIARALNCIGADGKGGPTTEPCGVCDPCVAIAASRHVDVMEMDAASRTGVDDIREIIEGVRFAPALARYKIYIVDEVHMLSRNAFNALLKTLEEPPAHVKFIFATTEIRKLPVTVLSRCQRFDLRRVGSDLLVPHLAGICESEAAQAEPQALAMIARAAEGSVRDALSLLDQAIAHGAGAVTAAQVRDMLGLADRARVLDLAQAVFAGETAAALAILREQYDLGADPAVVLGDLAETVHWLTRLKIVPEAGADAPEAERELGAAMAGKLAMAHLTRAWQMLMRGLQETRAAPSPIVAAEMALIRLAFAADLPTPAEALRTLSEDKASPGVAPTAPTGGGDSAPRAVQSGATVLALRPESGAIATATHPMPVDFAGLVALCHKEREPVLATLLKDHVRPLELRPGRLTINPDERVPADFARRLKACLARWTGTDWQIAIASEGGTGTLRSKELAEQSRLREEALAHPLVRGVLAAFPGAELAEVRAPIAALTPPSEEETPE